jgi:organic radical activating enzyme
MHSTVYFDITGGCNAKCPLCSTARLTFGKRIEFIPVPLFAKALDRLIDLELVDDSSVIGLYSWGEPLLHPDLDGILSALNDRSLRCSFSTNASKKTNFSVSTKNVTDFVFSMPGFSQASYDKIHGLKFERVLDNIEATIANLHQTGFEGRTALSFHVYQFNVTEELNSAQEWCASRKIQLQPYYAFLNDYQLGRQFLANALPYDSLKGLSQKLFLHYVDDLVRSQPKDWRCPQWNQILTLNYHAEVLLCCVLPDGHPAQVLGSIFDLSPDEILRRKKTSTECDDCMSCGLAYWVHNPLFLPARELPEKPALSLA